VERRDSGWLIHSYRYVPEQLVRVITRSDGHVPVYASPRYERVATKQASKKEIRDAQRLLDCDPLHGNKPQARTSSPGIARCRHAPMTFPVDLTRVNDERNFDPFVSGD
jgi:hypothetical protein